MQDQGFFSFQTIWECAQAAKKPWQVPQDKTRQIFDTYGNYHLISLNLISPQYCYISQKFQISVIKRWWFYFMKDDKLLRYIQYMLSVGGKIQF